MNRFGNIERSAKKAVPSEGPLSKGSMSQREVILFARGSGAHLELVAEAEELYLVRDGERVPEMKWHKSDVIQATDTFHRLMKVHGLL